MGWSSRQGASAGSQATWLTLSVPSEGAGWLWGPAGETSGMGVLPAHGTPRRWLRHWENQFTRKLTRMSRWVFLVIRFQPQALRTELAGPPSGSARGHWVILLPPRGKEGGLAEIGLICPYTSLQASVLSPQKGLSPALFFLRLGAHPHPHFTDDIAEAQSEGTRSGSKEAGSGQGLGELPLLLPPAEWDPGL